MKFGIMLLTSSHYKRLKLTNFTNFFCLNLSVMATKEYFHLNLELRQCLKMIGSMLTAVQYFTEQANLL